MTVYTPLWLGPKPGDTEGPEYAAREDRQILATLFTEGVGNVQAGHLAVTQRAAGANMTVEVAAGTCYVTGDDVTRQGMYRTDVTAIESVTIAAAPASNSRIDLIVARVYDAQEIGGAKHGLLIEAVTGSAAPSPVAPPLPNTAIPLAQVFVAAGATSIVAANIADRRTQSGASTLKIGTQAQPMTTAERDALPASEAFEGRFIDNISTGKTQIRRSNAWVNIAPPSALKASGSYAGNNNTSRLISVGFSPDLVFVSSNNGMIGWIHSSDTNAQQSQYQAGGTNWVPGETLAAGGFVAGSPSAGSGAALNKLGTTYYWTAFKLV